MLSGHKDAVCEDFQVLAVKSQLSLLLAPSLSPGTEDQGLLWGVREVMGLRPAGFKFGEGLNLAASTWAVFSLSCYFASVWTNGLLRDQREIWEREYRMPAQVKCRDFGNLWAFYFASLCILVLVHLRTSSSTSARLRGLSWQSLGAAWLPQPQSLPPTPQSSSSTEMWS